MFLLFAGYQYYPAGGWADYSGSYQTLEEAKAAFGPTKHTWAHIVHEGRIVADSDEGNPWEDK